MAFDPAARTREEVILEVSMVFKIFVVRKNSEIESQKGRANQCNVAICESRKISEAPHACRLVDRWMQKGA